MAISSSRWPRWTIWVAGGLGGLLTALLLLLAFGWPLLRRPIAHWLSTSLHRPVRIGAIVREGGTLLTPTVRLTDVAIGGPASMPDVGIARVESVRIRLPLLGQAQPQIHALDGVALHLVRDLAGRANWRSGSTGEASGGMRLDLSKLVIRSGRLQLDDATKDRHLTARFAIDAAGLRLTGQGQLAGSPARLDLSGGRLDRPGRWPFRIALLSPVLTLRAEGSAMRPLDAGHFHARIRTNGRDLKDLDRVIEAGLPGSQPFRLTADVMRADPVWTVTDLAGRIGRSDVAGHVTVAKRDGRTRLDGALDSSGFDFDDLASAQGLAKAAAKRARIGPRMLPETRIDLTHLRDTDGVLRVTLRRLLSRTPSAIRSVSGTLALDHGVLTVAPLTAAVGAGRVTGQAIVRHQSGAPLLSVALTLTGGRLEEVFTRPDTATGALSGRVLLTGTGETIRAALGRSTGVVALVARDGRIDRRAALLAGSDVGRAFFAHDDEAAPLRCVAARFTVRGGMAQAGPLILDTGVGRADGSGTIDLATERLNLSLTGRSKLKGGLRLDTPVRIAGVIEDPKVIAPPSATSASTLLRMIGRAIRGGQPAQADDVDCAALTARVLR